MVLSHVSKLSNLLKTRHVSEVGKHWMFPFSFCVMEGSCKCLFSFCGVVCVSMQLHRRGHVVIFLLSFLDEYFSIDVALPAKGFLFLAGWLGLVVLLLGWPCFSPGLWF